jgi:hypothetical protein
VVVAGTVWRPVYAGRRDEDAGARVAGSPLAGQAAREAEGCDQAPGPRRAAAQRALGNQADSLLRAAAGADLPAGGCCLLLGLLDR